MGGLSDPPHLLLQGNASYGLDLVRLCDVDLVMAAELSPPGFSRAPLLNAFCRNVPTDRPRSWGST